MAAICLRVKITFDPWQESAGKAILAKRADGLYAADAVVLSIPRQVGKTFLVGSITLALCIQTPRTTAIWTAHHGKTALDTFADLKALAQRPEVAPFVRSVYDSGGRMEIVFTNGSRICVGAREHGFGRGFKKIGILIFDEAQILTENAIDDIVPTANRHPNPLIFYMGTPPKPSNPSEVFTRLRAEALSGESTDTLYLEFSADADADPADREQWAKANPSYPTHTTARAMLRMKKMLSPDSFLREALGIWDNLNATGVFPVGAWPLCFGGWSDAKRSEPREPVGEPLALGISADLDQAYLSLGAVVGDGDRKHLGLVTRMLVEQRAGFVAEVKRVQDERQVPVGIDPKGPASFLIEELEAAGVELTRLPIEDQYQAHADLVRAVVDRTVTHSHYAELDAAIDAAGWRTVNKRRLFAAKSGDISALEAVANALRADAIGANYDVLQSAW